jgi:hypothetical protein
MMPWGEGVQNDGVKNKLRGVNNDDGVYTNDDGVSVKFREGATKK